MRSVEKIRNRLMVQRSVLLRELAQVEDALRWLGTPVGPDSLPPVRPEHTAYVPKGRARYLVSEADR